MENNASCSAVVVAAGQGKRMGTIVSKQFLKLNDKEVLIHTLLRFEKCEKIQEIVVVTGAEDIAFVKNLIVNYGIKKVTKVVAGGKERQDSVYAGICEVNEQAKLIAVHDGARPFIYVEDISKTILQAEKTGAAALGVPVKDTLKESNKQGNIAKTIDRSNLWAIQTPQIFKKEILLRAFKTAIDDGFLGTDECVLVERMNVSVSLVAGHYDNIKITTKEDLYMGEAILKNQKEVGA